MKKIHVKIFIFVFLFSLVLPARAAIIFPTGIVSGTISEAVTFGPIPDATVTFSSPFSGDIVVPTNTSGEYTLETEFCGFSMTVTIEAPGFETFMLADYIIPCFLSIELSVNLNLEASGYSNVAFLPGLQASRLYQQGLFFENKLWEPNRNADVEKLFMDDSGESIEPDIYTRDVIDEVFGSTGNIYKTFLEFLDDLVDEGTINEYRALPHDWRYDVVDVAESAIVLENDLVFLVDEIEELADSSQTGKVTIITHSNGGLLAKALMTRLETLGESDLVDKLIMVAAPQVGTPKALASLLHGHDQGLAGGFVMTETHARELGENMPGAHGLLPSSKYFDLIASPVIEFNPNIDNIYDFTSIYGSTIDSAAEFNKFLLGDDGLRVEPGPSDLNTPNVLQASFLGQAAVTHNLIDNWQPPSGIEVTQIAGWGLDTISGVKYNDCFFPGCTHTLGEMDRDVLQTEDGDGTVVSPSAVSMSLLGIINDEQDYYVNLKKYNRFGQFQTNRKHHNVIEIEELQNLIEQIIKDTVDTNNLPEFINSDKPISNSDDKKLLLKVKSPISIDAYDSFGNHVGLIPNPDPDSDLQLYEELIPNSYYFQIGGKKYLGLDTKDIYEIKIQGLELGTFTLEIEEVFSDIVTNTISYIDIPVSPNTKGSLTVQTVDSATSLKLDINGDGEVDMTLEPGEGPDSLAQLKILKKTIKTLDIHKGLKKGFIRQVQVAKKLVKRGLPKVASRILNGLVIQLRYMPKFLISPEDSKGLIEIIGKIRASLI